MNHPAKRKKITFATQKLRSRPPYTSLCHSPPLRSSALDARRLQLQSLPGLGASGRSAARGTWSDLVGRGGIQTRNCSLRLAQLHRRAAWGALNGGDGPRWCRTNTTATAGSGGGPAVATAEGPHMGPELDDAHRVRPGAARVAGAHPRAAPGALHGRNRGQRRCAVAYGARRRRTAGMGRRGRRGGRRRAESSMTPTRRGQWRRASPGHAHGQLLSFSRLCSCRWATSELPRSVEFISLPPLSLDPQLPRSGEEIAQTFPKTTLIYSPGREPACPGRSTPPRPPASPYSPQLPPTTTAAAPHPTANIGVNSHLTWP